MTFGEKIKKLRESRLLSQQKVADDLDIAQSSVASYERGIRSPSVEMISKFAEYYGIPFAALAPSPEGIDDSLAFALNESLQQNKKLGQLFEKAQYLTDAQLDAVLVVVNTMVSKRPEE